MKFILISYMLLFSFTASAQSLTDLITEATDLFQKGEYGKAILPAQKAALSIKEAMGEDNMIYMAMLTIQATGYLETFQYLKAESNFIHLAELLKKTDGEKSAGYAACLNNLASVYTGMGQYEKAEPLYIRTKEIKKEIVGENNVDYAVSLNNLALLYQEMGQYARAEPLYLKAIEIKKKLLGENNESYASNLNNLASLYLELGQYEKAEPLLTQASAIRKKVFGENHAEYATSLNNLGSLWEDRKQYEKAEQFYLQAMAIRKKVLGVNHFDYASSLNNLASLYSAMGQYEKAITYMVQAKEIWRNVLGENHPVYATCLNNLAALYRRSEQQYSKAEALYTEAIAIRKRILGEAHPMYADSQSDLALLYTNMRQYAKAEPLLLTSSRNVLQNLVNNFTILSEKEKRNYLDNNFFTTELNNSFLYYYRKASAAIIKNNFNLQLGFKSLSLADTKNMLESIRSSKDTAIKRIFNNWQADKILLAKQYALTTGSRITGLKKIEEEAEALEKELNRRSAGFRNQQTTLRVSVQDVQKNLEADEVAIEFVRFRLYNKKWTDSVIYAAYVLHKNDSIPVFIPLFEEKQLQQLCEKNGKSATTLARVFYKTRGLKVPGVTAETMAGSDLYKLIWQPLEPYLKGIKKIGYSPAGKLYGIAFHALPCEEDKMLLDKYQLQQYASTRQIALRTLAEQNIKPLSIVLFGDADFTMDSLQLVKEGGKSPLSSYIPPIRGLSNTEWQGLPGTGEEVRKIGQLFEKNKISTKVYIQRNASEANLKTLNGRSPQVLHIATHGFFLPELEKKQADVETNTYKTANDPLLRSGLILAGGNYAWSGKTPIDGVDDGILTAYEIAQLNLSNTVLVALSACETALGDVQGSEGVFGLQRGFKMAGTKEMIVSLWQVPDKETVELMTGFYSYWMQGKTIAASFYQAQGDMRKKYDPFYWAAFVLVE